MSDFILTEEQWAELEKAEARYDAWNQYGLHNVTDVIGREDSQMQAMMWANAEWGVEAYSETEGADGPRELTPQEQQAEIARRVVVASLYLYTGEIAQPKVPA